MFLYCFPSCSLCRPPLDVGLYCDIRFFGVGLREVFLDSPGQTVLIISPEVLLQKKNANNDNKAKAQKRSACLVDTAAIGLSTTTNTAPHTPDVQAANYE